MDENSLDLERLLKLRLVVARFGEKDGANWWNTNGLLGRQGAVLMSRGFPKTHRFAQARVVFAVARARCNELFSLPGSMTLWALPAEVEDRFDARWQEWLDTRERWADFFKSIETMPSDDLVECLKHLDLLAAEQEERVTSLRRSAEGRAVPISGTHQVHDEIVTLLAAGFSRGEASKPAIPYAQVHA